VPSSTSSSLTLRALLKAAGSRAGLGVSAPEVAGLSAAAKALLVAHAAREGTVVLVVPSDGDVESITSDVRFFVGSLEGLADTDLERSVLPFPSTEVDPYRGLAPHLDVASARARALYALATGTARIVIASAPALMPRVTPPAELASSAIRLAPGIEISPVALGGRLAAAGFTREDPVDEHGEFCVRGGVVDIFPAGDAQPIRIEFIGDLVDSLRRYDSATQRSVAALDQALVVPMRETIAGDDDAPHADATFLDFVLGAHRVYVSEPGDVLDAGKAAFDQIAASYADALARDEPGSGALGAPAKRDERGAGGPASNKVPLPEALVAEWAIVESWLAGATRLTELAIENPAEDGAAVHIDCQPALEFRGRIADWVTDVRRAKERGETVLFVAASPGRAERIVELLAEFELVGVPIETADEARGAAVVVALGHLTRGFRLPAAALQIYAETDVFDEERKVHERRKSVARSFLSDFRDLKIGDFVVHVDHGIGRFVGLKQIAVGQQAQEFMELRYFGEDKLFIPVERLDLVQKYTGSAHPSLDRLGGTTWEKAKTRVKKAMRDMAEELLKLYAARKAMPGHAFSPDTHWQQEFEDAFEYELTPDQHVAIAEIKRDMESSSPMDRLLCGDVGYGKTEVAMRAAFKVVLDSKQVAFLAPTTILAFQHLKTLKDRFAGFPVNIDMISRFRTNAEQKQTLADLAAGKVDIIVGTHRLLSKDVQFRDLGLLVVDEEQRFGVAHKERLKQLRKRVDVLTMTATPIPRTLNMSLVGIRDMSIIETPPKDRLSIQTHVVKFDSQVIARAVRTELERGGQIYFVHNRVESIYSLGNLLTRLVPDARIVVGHGQMGQHELEKVMVDFVARKHDVLLATTIVENGLDIPNANTIIVNRADRYGLSQLYQLRGRVGRSDRRAYAYLLIPPEDSLSPVARKRLAAIREFSDLGSGFRVAALDLEIRGAGNLLGGEQSGQIEAVGFDMYMKLLEQTVRELRGEDLEDELRATVNLKIDLRIENEYIPDMNQRLTVYRRIASARTESELERILDEIGDRYGPPPVSVLNLAEYGRIRVLADALRIETIDREGQLVVFKFRSGAPIDAARLVKTAQTRPDVVLSPPASVKLDLRVAPEGRPAARPPQRPPEPDRFRARRRPLGPGESPTSWWTTRATAGEVKPGFTRDEILRAAPEDPRSPGGLFERVSAFLAELRPTA
jgi:transcription-repair coupling factor (superfamily II helicase)